MYSSQTDGQPTKLWTDYMNDLKREDEDDE